MTIAKFTIQRKLDTVPIYLNVDRIISIHQGYDGVTVIDFGNGDDVEVEEVPEKVVEIINKAKWNNRNI